MDKKTSLLLIKIILACLALFLAINRGKKDKNIFVYWILVTIYWLLNALS